MANPIRLYGITLSQSKRVFLVVGEASGDALGAALVDALRSRHGDAIDFMGLAGTQLELRGVKSLFELEDIAVMGLAPVIKRLPTILARLKMTSRAIVDAQPDLLIVIDSPDFCHRVAKRVRADSPNIPIIGWVSPSVWAWRPGRAKKMRAYIDHLLALLPFEVDVHQRLGGPPTTYVGHPLLAGSNTLHAARSEQALARGTSMNGLLALPGSRSGEISRHLPLLRETIERMLELDQLPGDPKLTVTMPVLSIHEARIKTEVANWPVQVDVVSGEEEKEAAFAAADAAIAASGTVTLELALARVPMVVIYKLDPIAHLLRSLVKAWTIVLPNLVWGRPVIREYVDEYARPEALARALTALMTDTPERRAQLEAFDELHERFVSGGDGGGPALNAALVVERFLKLEPSKAS